MTEESYDVVVAGAGPVGLMLACELRLRGVSTLVLDPLAERSDTIKAGAINVPTAEAFYRRGLLAPLSTAVMERTAELLPEVRKMFERGGMKKIGGHFAGLFKLDPTRLDPADPDVVASDKATAIVAVAQQQIEELLEKHALELGVELRRGCALTSFTARADGVTVHTGQGDVEAAWLVGCDGGRSTVRKTAGFDFPGTAPTITGHQAIVDIDGAELLGVGWQRVPDGMYVHGPIKGRILTVEFDGPPADRDDPVTAQELENSLRRLSQKDVRITGVRTATRWTDNARQATTYRMGRVLLAGDAAHVHSPFGGQGLNLGIGDAMNLGWKLAATVKGTAPDGLLDTYTEERHPLGARVLEMTRAQVALMRPDPLVEALRTVVSDLMDLDEGNQYFTKFISGMTQTYALGDHPLVGRRAPDPELADGRRIGELQQDGSAILLDLDDSAALREAVEGADIRVVTTICGAHPEWTGVLIRPDGYVAWATDDGTTDGLAEAVARWFERAENH
ncbi:FAD-dependent oxidoreductase [Labedaea rhizosphaerae]|uniref:2-polyprenyl-6-methoxyphenol hydroxylase-like FAD-dependent oxidoreductase n=1 Tax=Labedaea rhizosphaerae TaxID=598644 RepID=A0A4V6PVX2_LABRH|nr:FAD-dependent oxidoreductase [Labedaea rhizosphaerae]TDQ04585.1 2-polyprenyl-6-methoxyphenol hydroxylase-like FAD-dependent oxidoreductase [Labedaea rhizosphaerae]